MKEIKPSDSKRISGGATRFDPEGLGLDPLPSPRAEPNELENPPVADPTGVAPRQKL